MRRKSQHLPPKGAPKFTRDSQIKQSVGVIRILLLLRLSWSAAAFREWNYSIPAASNCSLSRWSFPSPFCYWWTECCTRKWRKHWSIHNLQRIKSWNSTSPPNSSKSSCAGSARPRPIRPWKFDGDFFRSQKRGLVNSSPTELRD